MVRQLHCAAIDPSYPYLRTTVWACGRTAVIRVRNEKVTNTVGHSRRDWNNRRLRAEIRRRTAASIEHDYFQPTIRGRVLSPFLVLAQRTRRHANYDRRDHHKSR